MAPKNWLPVKRSEKRAKWIFKLEYLSNETKNKIESNVKKYRKLKIMIERETMDGKKLYRDI